MRHLTASTEGCAASHRAGMGLHPEPQHQQQPAGWGAPQLLSTPGCFQTAASCLQRTFLEGAGKVLPPRIRRQMVTMLCFVCACPGGLSPPGGCTAPLQLQAHSPAWSSAPCQCHSHTAAPRAATAVRAVGAEAAAAAAPITGAENVVSEYKFLPLSGFPLPSSRNPPPPLSLCALDNTGCQGNLGISECLSAPRASVSPPTIQPG